MGRGVKGLIWLIPGFLVPLLIFSGLLVAQKAGEEREPWSFLSLSASGADQFLRQHTRYDGRGVVIAILDTGVDMGIPGLTETSTGEIKVIDVQDFSKQGEVTLSKAKVLDKTRVADDEKSIILCNVDKLPFHPKEGIYYIGTFDEKRFKNSSVKDINANGYTDDLFGVLAYEVKADTGNFWVAYVDTDLDGEIDDERPLRDYKINYDSFTLHRVNPDKQTRPMTFAINILPEEKKVCFHFADSGHGTHVAGIAAGYRINGQEGFNGLAPGAKVISLKIGDCTLAGGATVTGSMKKAYEYAADFAKEKDIPVVINMSYGIGSELDGESDIDKFIDDLMEKNEGLAVCLSAGNGGPGLSTIGTPSASERAFTIGALMAQEVARDAYGAVLPGHRILHFSSRGGELTKPDVVAPGAAVSTVPRWAKGDRYWGTSMASPYAAGVMALLLSGTNQVYPEKNVAFVTLKRAIRNSATGVSGYSFLDQGAGLINVPGAFDLVMNYLKGDRFGPVLDFKVRTFSPTAPRAKGRAAFWRSPYYPNDRNQLFKISPVFSQEATADQKSGYFKAFRLKSDVDWLKPVQSSVYIRGEGSAKVSVQYQSKRLRGPGVYTGKVIGYFKQGGTGRGNTAFELWNTVVIPYTFNADNHYARELKDQRVEPLMVKRYFIEVPAGASLMALKGSVPKGKFAWMHVEVCDPQGHTYRTLPTLNSRENWLEGILDIPKRDLTPGVWEVATWGNLSGEKTSRYKLSVQFYGFDLKPSEITEIDFGPGESPTGEITVTNLFDRPFRGRAEGGLDGFRKVSSQELKPTEEFTYPFHLDQTLTGVKFTLSMSPEDHSRFTDIAVNIEDKNGEVLTQTGFTYRECRVSLKNPHPQDESTEYILKVVPGCTHEDSDPVSFDLEEIYLTADPIKITATYADERDFILVPGVPAGLTYELEKSPPTPPNGFHNSGELVFREKGTDQKALVVPVRLNGE